MNKTTSGLRVFDKGKANAATFELPDFVAECVRIAAGSLYIFCAIEQVSPLAHEMSRHGLTFRLGFWEKTNPSPVNGEHMWLSATEPCIYARKSGATFLRHCLPAVWRFPSGSSKNHPTEKPEPLFRYLIESSSGEGDTVVDPCGGSGTSLEASFRSSRSCLSAELDPVWADGAWQRIAPFLEQTDLGLGLDAAA